MAKPKPPVEAVVDTAVHPLFARLREEAGFAEFSGTPLPHLSALYVTAK